MKPAVIVAGCGRSGTNIVLELLRGNPAFNASEPEEDKLAFSRHRNIDPGYLTKCDTVYFEAAHAQIKLQENPYLYIVWTMRDPRDMIMSKMRRGVPESEGGDCKGYASDGSVSGAIDDINRSIKMLAEIRPMFPHRVRVVKMENVLSDPGKEAGELCEWLDLKYYKGMTYFWKRMRNRHKARRYRMLDKKQIALWKMWKEYENGWFVQKQIDLGLVFPKVVGIANYFGYPTNI